jgi:hypothetical protein
LTLILLINDQMIDWWLMMIWSLLLIFS